MNQQYTSAKTSINSTKLPRTFAILEKLGVIESGQSIIDIGGGKFNNAIEFVKNFGATMKVYDKFNRSEAENTEALSTTQYDIALCSNVLNVIQEEEIRAEVIKLASEKADTAYFLIYEGDKSGCGKQTGTDSWQNNMKTAQYISEISQHFKNVKTKHGLIVATNTH